MFRKIFFLKNSEMFPRNVSMFMLTLSTRDLICRKRLREKKLATENSTKTQHINLTNCEKKKISTF